ncbi:hypothetical protein [Streptomyces cadmiisoli]|uniref:hypothetical protein n=1 Tax=Streptomyces cadmiisoli TaxID=2184053 RepID=UPI001FEA7D46|nr:hypothetical protein [Streptomyces cadmiisoli]
MTARTATPAQTSVTLILRETLNGHTYPVRADARGLIQDGRLNRRLFDITTLSSPAYAHRQDLRLIVRYDTARPAARTALRADARTQRTLTSINADALPAPAGDAQLWSTLTTGPAGAADRGTAPGIPSVWLDAVVEVSLDKSVPQIGGPQAWKAGLDGLDRVSPSSTPASMPPTPTWPGR